MYMEVHSTSIVHLNTCFDSHLKFQNLLAAFLINIFDYFMPVGWIRFEGIAQGPLTFKS